MDSVPDVQPNDLPPVKSDAGKYAATFLDPGHQITAAEFIERSKSILQSKTIWLNLLALLAAFIPAFREWIASNPQAFVTSLSIVNIIVRFATQDRVSIFPKKVDVPSDISPEREAGKGSGGSLPGFLLCTTASLLGVGALSSCNTTLPVRIGIETPHGSASYSSKHGITVDAVVPSSK